MSFRRFAAVAALAFAGLLAAVGIGLLANSISGDSVGLSAEPLHASETLAPSADDRSRARAAKRAARQRAARKRRAAARRRTQRLGQQRQLGQLGRLEPLRRVRRLGPRRRRLTPGRAARLPSAAA